MDLKRICRIEILPEMSLTYATVNGFYMTLAKTDVGSVFFHATDTFPNRLQNKKIDGLA